MAVATKSPFPGMDPWIERFWLDLHVRLNVLSSIQLNERLPADLVATNEEYATIGEREPKFRPDVQVREPSPAYEQDDNGGVAVVTAPGVAQRPALRLQSIDSLPKPKRVRIEEADTGRLITIIEWLSPVNKQGFGRRQHLAKRSAFVAGGVHVIEVDLCRTGNWKRMYDRFGPLRPEHEAPYRVATHYASAAHEVDERIVDLIPVQLADVLPEVAVPLRPGDPTVLLSLQPMLDEAYRTGRYGLRTDYAAPPDPPLSAKQAAWAADQLEQRSAAEDVA